MQNGILRCVPSDRAITNFKYEIEELILGNENKQTQSALIKKINEKITGFTTYQKCEESKEVVRHLDVFINAFLLKLMVRIYPDMKIEQIQKKYWKVDSARQR